MSLYPRILGGEYIQIKIGVVVKSFSGENLSIQYRRCNLVELKKYGPSSKTQSLSSMHAKITMKNTFDANFKSIFPFIFHKVFTQLDQSFI
jgi:hypothetical protein